VEKVWEYWTAPEHVMKWNFASEDWKTSKAENDLRAGGKFVSRMEAKDGSVEMQQKGWQSILDNFKKYAEQVYNN